ncbi:MAG: helix-turn-helix domain-containing protein [Actinobacteria bacterium]|nr:helix-turn-helix domain-containing protein [Actinomycetota bacterium]
MKNKKDDNYIEIGYKFKIYPTEEQKAFFEKHFGCVRFIYNYLLNLRTEVYKKDKTNISGYEAKAFKKLQLILRKLTGGFLRNWQSIQTLKRKEMNKNLKYLKIFT